MHFNELQSWILPIVWSLAAVGVGLICGFFAGRTYALSNEPRRLKRDRERTLEALINVITSTDQLNSDVTHHSTALQHAESEIKQCDSSGQFVNIQDSLVQNLRHIVQVNQKMENDLVVSKFKLEETAQQLDRSRKEARTDSLCKVANRKAVDETLNFLVSRFQSQKKSFGLMLIDIDHFKRINDTFGHEAGDEVLINVGKALKECVRPVDFVGRLGGDEFVLMIEGLNDTNAEFVGKRIRSTIELYNFSVGHKGESTVVTLSMGLTVIRTSDSAKDLYRRADHALYRSKELGRNQLFTIVDTVDKTAPRPESPAATYDQIKASIEGQQTKS